MSKSMETIIGDFVARQRTLLELELQAEQEVEQQASAATTSTRKDASASSSSSSAAAGAANGGGTAVVLRDLQVSEVSVGLYGRTVVTLTTMKMTKPTNTESSSSTPSAAAAKTTTSQEPLLPAHRFTVGGEVEIRSSSSSPKESSSGVISAVTDTSISLALFSDKRQRRNNNNTKKDKTDNGNDDNDDDDEENMLGPPPLMIVPKSAMEVHRKLIQALDQLQQHGVFHPIAGNVVKACFTTTGTTTSTISTTTATTTTSTILKNTKLDDSQQEAIRFCLESSDRPVTLCHGPPGTGKTTTMAELIRQAVQVHHMKVLVTAPSNVAVDNILERLVQTMSSAPSSTTNNSSKRKATTTTSSSSTAAAAGGSKSMRMVRLGHPARIKPSILPYSLESLVYHAEGTEIVADVRKELQSFLQILNNNSNKKKTRGVDRKLAYQEVKRLRKEVQQRETKVVQELLSKAHVILATTVGAANFMLRRFIPDGFDVVIIDEAAQALEASCWIPALQGKRLILAGDHCQLPPTIQNVKVQAELGKTLFERVMELYKEDDDEKDDNQNKDRTNTHFGVDRVSRMLQVQYRMHESIANWASKAMYGGKLQTHASVQKRVLADLMVKKAPPSQPSPTDQAADDESDDHSNHGGDGGDDMSKTTLLWIDTAGCGMTESVNAAGSRYNEGEAQLVAQHVQMLLRMGIKSTDIAIITPYNGQVELLRSMLLSPSSSAGQGATPAPHLEIRSVDGFQGGEREAVVISLVRSSERNGGGRGSNAGIGFLRDDRRLNVAVTRAKRHCAVIGDSETVCESPLIRSLFRWMENHGEQRSAMEYLQSQENYDDAVQADLRDAQKMLRKIMAAEASKSANNTNNNNNKSGTKPKRPDHQLAEEEKCKALLDKISTFAEKGKQGDEMILSTELSRYDRKVVHEFATKLGLEHASQGTEGVDRRIVLIIPNTAPAAEESATTIAAAAVDGGGVATILETDNDVEEDVHFEKDTLIREEPKSASAFAALHFDDDDDSDSDDSEDSKREHGDDTKAKSGDVESPTAAPVMNNTLAALARERAERERAKAAAAKTAAASPEKVKKAPKPKGVKLGGNKRTPPQAAPSLVEEAFEDDMAFLNAQVEKVQTSHGRRVEGTGTNYRTVVNGILVAKPPPRVEEKKNKQASASLQSKLKSAQEDRKAKGAKKKK